MADKVNTYNVVARVISKAGHCSAKHEAGDTWNCGHETPEGICIWAWTAIFPFVTLFRYGGGLPWKEGPYRVTLACPDPLNKVVLEVMRGEQTA
jgi:uncharacterized repeat protein (TIGR04076 family)